MSILLRDFRSVRLLAAVFAFCILFISSMFAATIPLLQDQRVGKIIIDTDIARTSTTFRRRSRAAESRAQDLGISTAWGDTHLRAAC